MKKAALTGDVSQNAKRIVELSTGIINDKPSLEDLELRKLAAQVLGRSGGLKGGPARAKKLSKSKRSQIAKNAALARWAKRKAK